MSVRGWLDLTQHALCLPSLSVAVYQVTPNLSLWKQQTFIISWFLWVEIQEHLSCGSARVAVIWRLPGSGRVCLFLSSLMYMLAGSFSSLLVSGSYCKISYDMASSRARDTREQERKWSRQEPLCLYNLILKVTCHHFCSILSDTLVQSGRWLCRGAGVQGWLWRMWKSGQQVTMWSLGWLILREKQL